MGTEEFTPTMMGFFIGGQLHLQCKPVDGTWFHQERIPPDPLREDGTGPGADATFGPAEYTSRETYALVAMLPTPDGVTHGVHTACVYCIVSEDT